MFPLKQVDVAVDVPAVTQRVVRVFTIESVVTGDGREEIARYHGLVNQDSDQAYRWLRAELKPLGCTPLFRKDGARHLIIVKPGIIDPPGSRMWLVWLLLGLTILSMLYTGGSFAYEGPGPQSEAEMIPFLFSLIAYIPLGWPFMLSMISILGAHELGHYIAARLHGEPASPPFFIPLPYPLSVFGTLGAVITLKSPPTNRRVLLDIGIAGPLAGLIVGIPILIFGLATSPLQPLAADQVTNFEGNSILYVLLKYAVFGRFLPEPASFGDLPGWLYMLRFYTLGVFTPGGGTDVFLNDVAWAGWAGLLITSLNLIPVGQLDGGHAMNVLLGPRGQRVIWPLAVGGLVVLGFVWPGWWLWAALVFVFGRQQLEALDQITEIGPGRRGLALLMPIVWVLLFIPVPLQV
jgi:hypothetical protein